MYARGAGEFLATTSSSKLMIKKPSTIKTVDGFGELLGLA